MLVDTIKENQRYSYPYFLEYLQNVYITFFNRLYSQLCVKVSLEFYATTVRKKQLQK